MDIMLYFWDDRDGPDFCGWWFGPKAGGNVWFSLGVWEYRAGWWRSSLGLPPRESAYTSIEWVEGATYVHSLIFTVSRERERVSETQRETGE